jgi:catalase
VRGFATKFYTEEGNWDIVGNNIPVFFIQESIKFPDFVHAVKPEPHNEVPQGQSAHNNFWDFVGLQPEGKAAPSFFWLPSFCSPSRDQPPTWSCGSCLIEESRGLSG